MNPLRRKKASGPLVSRALSTVLLVTLLVAGACTSEAASSDFDDHTVARIDSSEAFDKLAKMAGRQASVKFTIPDMAKSSDVFWMDSNFYSLHDEWYWFRLLNDQSVPAINVEPESIDGESFESIGDIYEWADNFDDAQLPLDLARSEERIYSKRFYDEAVDRPSRNYGIGTLVRFETVEAGSRWFFELEYSETPKPDDLELFFERLRSVLSTEISDDLAWVVRSPEQETLAQEMERNGSAFADRIVRYSELVPAGEVDVYNEGISAGRLRLVDDSEDATDLSETTEEDLLILESIPDWLPPAAAIISSNPQTPLAHVNLLAKNRGIPNASVSGITDNPGLQRAARVAAPAIIKASGEELTITLISEQEYRRWRDLGGRKRLTVPKVDLDEIATIVDLNEIAEQVSSEADIAALRPTVGGKVAGFLTLLAAQGVETPQKPLAITVKPYFAHLELVDSQLAAILSNKLFQTSTRVRFLLLEDRDDYAKTFTTNRDAVFADEFVASHPADSELGKVLSAGGFKKLFRDKPISGSTLDEVSSALEHSYGDYSRTQGLRFRSSSSVEDLEGFSGAGLYDSNTGFLFPNAQEGDDQKKSVEYSIKKTWASYWSFEAYEERRQENIDHRSGGMAVLIHARFDDELEANNGVATFTILPEAAGDSAVAEINVQAEAVSVSNPDPDDPQLPEILEVRQADDGTLRVERLATSTLAKGQVMDDSAALELFGQLDSVAQLWLRRTNRDLTSGQQIQTLTLDHEFKTMSAGWPARSTGATQEPGRLVVKQARSLDPGLRGVASELLKAEIPRDVLARARLVERLDCISGETASSSYHIYTEPLAEPDLGYGQEPLVVRAADSPAKQNEAEGTETLEECEPTVILSSQSEFLTTLLEREGQPNLVGGK